jgi:hypothetical protein
MKASYRCSCPQDLENDRAVCDSELRGQLAATEAVWREGYWLRKSSCWSSIPGRCKRPARRGGGTQPPPVFIQRGYRDDLPGVK